MGQVYRVLHNVTFGCEVGKDIDRGVTDQQWLGIVGHVEREDMAHPAFRAQAGFLVQYRGQQFIGVNFALHQHINLARPRQGDGLFGGGVAVGGIDKLDARKVQPCFSRRRRYLGPRSDKNRNNHTLCASLQRTLQRNGVAGVNDGGTDRRKRRRCLHQGGKARATFMQVYLGQHHAGATDLFGGSYNQGLPLDHRFALLVGAETVKRDLVMFSGFGDNGNTDSDGIAKADGTAKTEVLVEVNRSRAGQFSAQHRRDQSTTPHAMGDDLVKHIGFGIIRIDMRGVHIAGHDGKQLYVIRCQSAVQHGAVTEAYFVVSPVFDEFHGGGWPCDK